MIDGNSRRSASGGEQRTPGPSFAPLQQPPGEDLYANLFTFQPHHGEPEPAEPSAPPPVPQTLQETGLSLSQLGELILKQLYVHGTLLGLEIARSTCLPFSIVEEGLRQLRDQHQIEVASGEVVGSPSYEFHLTDAGRSRAREALELCRYVGPAPVPRASYMDQCRRQAVSGTRCGRESLQEAFDDLVVPPELLEELGPAVCTGQSIFIYGPPGNGKTALAKGLGRFLNQTGGEIFVPYAIQTENSIVTIFDPTIHTATDARDASGRHAEQEPHHGEVRDFDQRWRRIRRPVVIAGGELTLEMLDLRYSRAGNFYAAPMHIKANGGVFLIDDFGRQIVSPRDLLNRWILPLEEHIDYLSLVTGKKFAVPFEQMIIFSTNLDPRELIDEAFLRRIRHKIKIGPPSRELFTEIFRLACQRRQIRFEPEAVDYLFNTFYSHGKPPRSSDPRDLLDIAQSICRFRNQQLVLTPELMREATDRFFCQL